MDLIKNLKSKYNMQAQCLCCDNAGENVAFKTACKVERIGIILKFTAPSTPQMNGQIELKFATFFSPVHSMLNEGNSQLF